MKRYLLIALIALVVCSCKTNLVYMSVQEPAPVFLSNSVKKIGIINRSLPQEKNQKTDDLDKILTLEGKELDKEGAEATVNGLNDELLKNNRFEEIVKVNRDDLKTTGSGIFPSALDWKIVENICTLNKVDALFSLEMFDTDARISYKANPITVSTPLGNVPGIEHEASLQTVIKTGWRIYDPLGHTIVDEYAMNESINTFGKGINPAKALAAITGRKDAVKNTASIMGQNYAFRIIPYWIRVTRDYYVKGTGNFETAKRRAQTGNWDGAAELWLKETNNSKPKIAGRACYNMAIINEINGDLDKAIEWAQKAYADYGDKLGLRYVNILKNRKARNNELQQQKNN